MLGHPIHCGHLSFTLLDPFLGLHSLPGSSPPVCPLPVASPQRISVVHLHPLGLELGMPGSLPEYTRHLAPWP